jgi:hypothetical protein
LRRGRKGRWPPRRLTCRSPNRRRATEERNNRTNNRELLADPRGRAGERSSERGKRTARLHLRVE